MLVLTRKVDESVVIADSIVITILSIEGDKVKLGIEAPREVPILRKELQDALHEQEQLASELSKSPSSATIEALRRLIMELDAPEEEPAPSSRTAPLEGER